MTTNHRLPVKKLLANPANPRTIKKHKLDQLVKSLRDFPQMLELRPIVVESLEHPVVLGGNMRLQALKVLGVEEVPVVPADGLTEAQRAEFVIKDNVGFGDWDWETLANEWDPMELSDWGLDIPDLAVNKASVEQDEVPELPSEPITKPGDLWLLGRHRLLCGDSTNTDDLNLLTENKKADLIFTDPPWNVNYGSETNNGNRKKRTILNDNMDKKQWQEFVSGFCSSFIIGSKPGAPIYVVMSAQEWPSLQLNLINAGFHWSSTIIWVKDRHVLSRKDYHTQFEPIWHGYNDDEYEALFYGWNEKAPRLKKVEDRKQSDIWVFERPSSSDLHPTTKPVNLIARAINNSSNPGDIVLDLFGGSGSTLITCEQTGRINFSMELDPKYCDVIVARWEKLTGQQAVRSYNLNDPDREKK